MGLFIRQDENRSELQERLAAELRARAMSQSQGSEPIDQTKNSNYVKDSERISNRTVTTVVIVAAFIAIVVAYIYTR